MNKLILITVVGLLVSVVGKAHIDYNSWHRHLVGARFTVEQDLNFPPGETKFVVSNLPGKVLSGSEYNRYKSELLKKAKVGDSYAVMLLTIGVPGGNSWDGWRASKSASVDILLGQNYIGEIAKYNNDTSLESKSMGSDPNNSSNSLNLYLMIGKLNVTNANNALKKDFMFEGNFQVTIGEFQDLLRGVINFDTTSIPVYRIGPNQ